VLNAQLRELLQRAELFQAISLLERSAPHARPLGHGSGRGEAVRLGGHVTLGFSPSDVVLVRQLGPDGAPLPDADAAATTSSTTAAPASAAQPAAPAAARTWQLLTPVLTLAGATGPLPLPYTEMLLQYRTAREAGRPAGSTARHAQDAAPMAFLDIFHHRWLSFLYRGRKLTRLSLQWEAPARRPLARALDAVSGLGLTRPPRGPGHEPAWLRHAGLMGPAPRSMAQLEVMLSDRLGVPVRGEQFVGGWTALDPAETPRLARGLSLGQRAVLGRRAWDSSAGARLHIGPVPLAQWRDYLPGGAALARLAWLVASHAQQDLQWHVRLQPEAAAAGAGARLGGALLGRSSWLRPGRTPRPLAPVSLRLPSPARAGHAAAPGTNAAPGTTA
jgi:type VI secretion system protein ImpH